MGARQDTAGRGCSWAEDLRLDGVAHAGQRRGSCIVGNCSLGKLWIVVGAVRGEKVKVEGTD